MRPGEHPVAELARALARVAPGEGRAGERRPARLGPGARSGQGERLVLAVDQLEEIFTACRDEGERADFVEAIVAIAADPDQRAVVVLGIRADFYGRCAEYPEFAAQMSANNVLVGPMRREELRRAIELPARRAGLRVEPSLTSALVGDVADEPGGLPLLSTTLVELWQERSGRTLRRSTLRAKRRRQRGGGPARRARLRSAQPAPARARAGDPPAAHRRRAAGAGEQAGRALRAGDRARRGRGRRPRGSHREPPGDGRRGHGRGRPRGAPAGVAAPPCLARRRHRGPAPSPAPDQCRRRVAGLWARTRRALPRRPARLGARLGGEPRSGAERARARVPRREPGGERARGRAAAASQSPAPVAAGRRRRPARRRGGRRTDRALASARGARARPSPPTPSGSGPRRSARIASTRRFCSPTPAPRSTTRSPPAPTCSRRSCAAPRRSGS